MILRGMMVEKGRIFLKFGLTFSNINAEPINWCVLKKHQSGHPKIQSSKKPMVKQSTNIIFAMWLCLTLGYFKNFTVHHFISC